MNRQGEVLNHLAERLGNAPPPAVPFKKGAGDQPTEAILMTTSSSSSGRANLDPAGGTPGVSKPRVFGPAPTAPQMQALGDQVVDWGQKHRHSTFRKVYETDPSYVAWMQARECGQMSSQLAFLKYCHFRFQAEAAAFE